MGAGAREVGCGRTTRHDHVAPPREGIRHKELKWPRLVAREAETSEIVALEEERGILAKPHRSVEWRRTDPKR